MFRKLVNECKIKFVLKAEGPVLIRSGENMDLDPTLPSVKFIRSFHNDEYNVVIPGSSIKGVFRSRVEKLLNGSCKIVSKNYSDSCSSKISKLDKNSNHTMKVEDKYKESCSACRLFGNMSIKSRAEFRDAYPIKDSVKLATRYNVGIDRVTGAAKDSALFEPEVLEAGIFEAEIIIKNFFLWQLKVLMQVFDDINEGYVTFGGVTSRGFGRMSADSVTVSVREYGAAQPGQFYNEKLMSKDEIVEKLKDVTFSENETGKVKFNNEHIL